MESSKHISSVYKTYSKFLVLSSARFHIAKNLLMINSKWTLKDVVCSKSKGIDVTFTVNDNYDVVSQSPCIILDDEIIIDTHSKCGLFRVICFERKTCDNGSKESKENVIHIWYSGLFLKSINLKDIDVHGPIYKIDFSFGSLQVVAGGKYIVYVAEAKKVKRVSHFQTQGQVVKECGNQYLSKDDFGEQLDDVQCPVLCLLDIDKETVDLLDMLPVDMVAGHVRVHPLDHGFVITAYKRTPYQLGLIYCTQRQSELFYYDIGTKTIARIGDHGTAKMSPRFSLDGRYLIWLENDASGPHMQCQRLMCYDWSLKSTVTVVDVVRDSVSGFTGIYNLGLSDNCWHRDNRHVFLTTLDRCETKIISVDIESRLIKRLEVENRHDSATLLDINDDFLLLKVSSPSLVPYIAVANIESALDSGKLSIKSISTVHKIDTLDWCMIEHSPSFTHPKYGANKFQSIFISPRNADKSPLILALHGGPHSAFSNEFQLFFAAAVELGFSCLLVNYRGSWGYGQDSIDSLLGYVGEMDVSDCIKACEDVLQSRDRELDASNIFLYGGSHGGFLAAHLSAKYSSRTRAMACRNPVINIPAMVTSSDIPDWTYTETGFQWNFQRVLGEEQLLRMWAMSPLRSVDAIKCPVLVMIGQNDKRVPPSQGKELVRALLSRNIPCELHIYPKDCHPLASNEASSDCFVNVIGWFSKYLVKD